jgi:hypothetical protein
MDIMISTLVQGGFSNAEVSLYVLLLNEYIYIGKTGTSNNTGRSAPYERLGTHIRKSGKTKSVIWDDLFLNRIVSPEVLSVRMINAFVPGHLIATRIERAIIWQLQEGLEDGIVRNKPELGLPSDLTIQEQEYADVFTGKLMSERYGWLASKFGTNCDPDISLQQHDGDQ